MAERAGLVLLAHAAARSGFLVTTLLFSGQGLFRAIAPPSVRYEMRPNHPLTLFIAGSLRVFCLSVVLEETFPRIA